MDLSTENIMRQLHIIYGNFGSPTECNEFQYDSEVRQLISQLEIYDQVCDEIGHVILHLENTNSFIDDTVTINGKSTDEKEQEANYFAACLLMPSDDVDRFIDLEILNFQERGLSVLDIARIMSEFSVSFGMALNRLESLEAIDLNEKLRLDNEKTEKKVGNLLRSVGGNARLNEPSKEIDIPYEYIDYAIYNYNHNVIPKETLEKVLDCYHLDMEDVSDKLIEHSDATDDDLDDLLGGLDD